MSIGLAKTPGTVNRRYELIRRLGEGSQATVFLSRDLGRKDKPLRALKLLKLAHDRAALGRMKAEFVRFAQVQHPNLSAVYDLDQVTSGPEPFQKGQPFFTAEFAEGESPEPLLEKVDEKRRVEFMWRVLEDVCGALDALHGHGIVHRDVKPSNIVVNPELKVMLLDLGLSVGGGRGPASMSHFPGIAGVGGAGAVAGTPAYMAPETLLGQADSRSDLYSLGASLYHLAAGRPPRGGLDVPLEEAVRQVLSVEPDPIVNAAAWVGQELADVIDRLTASRPTDRYPSARALIEDVARVRRRAPLWSEGPAEVPLLRSELCGREAELKQLTDVILNAARRQGLGPHVALVKGEPGMGRSRLVTEAVRAVQVASVAHPSWTIRFSGDRWAQAEAFLRFRLETASETPKLESAGAELRWARMAEALEAQAAESPAALVILDDSLDEAIEFVKFVAAAPQPALAGAAVVLRAGPEHEKPLQELSAAGVHVTALTLGPLEQTATAHLASFMLGEDPGQEFVAKLHDASGGSPGLAVELLHSAWEAVRDRTAVREADPAALMGGTLSELMARRIKPVKGAARRVLEALSVWDRPAEMDVVKTLADVSVAEGWKAVEELVVRGLIAAEGDGIRILQRETARAVLKRMNKKRLQDRHCDAADLARAALSESPEPFPDEPVPDDTRLAHLAALADHLLSCGRSDREAFGACLGAADAYARALRPSRAAGYYEQAVKLGPPADGSNITVEELGLKAAECNIACGEYEDAARLLGRRPAGTGKRDPHLAGRGAVLRVKALQRGGSYSEARKLAVRELAGTTLGESHRAELTALLTRVHLASGGMKQARRIVESIESFPEDMTGVHLMESAGLTNFYSDQPEKALELFRRAEKLARRVDDPVLLARQLTLKANVHHSRGELTRASELNGEAWELARRSGDVHGQALYRANQGSVLWERGDFGGAMGPLVAAVRDLRRLGRTAELGLALYNLGNVLLGLGDINAATREGRLALDQSRRASAPMSEGCALLLLAEIACRQFTHRGANKPADDPVKLANEAAAIFNKLGAGQWEVTARSAAATAMIAAGGPAEELEKTLETLEGALDDSDPLKNLTALQALARAAVGRADVKVDASRVERRLDEALKALFESDLREYTWRLALLRALLARRNRDERRAQGLLERASAILDTLLEETPEMYRPGRMRDPEATLLSKSCGPRTRIIADPERVPARGGTMRSMEQTNQEEVLQRLLTINKRLASELRLGPLLEYILDTVIDLTGAERGFLLLREGDRFSVKAARNMDQADLERADGNRARWSRSIAEEAMEREELVVTVDAREDSRFSGASSVMDLRLRSVLAVPLMVMGRAVGTLYVENRLERGAFNQHAAGVALDLADQAAVAIHNAQLVEENLNRQEEIERLNAELEKKLEAQQVALSDMRTELRASREALQMRYDYSGIVGSSPAVLELFQLLDRITDTDLPVVILGESGTGKELVARAIHYNGHRRDQAFVSENCGAVPETLLESILFGHEKGAFTGASRQRRGLFEIADDGTLFLDEVGEMSGGMQVKLLRALQDGEFRRVGGNKVIKVNVRIVAASNKDLADQMEQGNFRRDLFYRLNVVTVRLPPLRERREDIPLLVDHFIEKHAPKGKRIAVHPPAMARLHAHDWPGNVRQLENEIMRALALSGDEIGLNELSPEVNGANAGGAVMDPDDLDLKQRIGVLERLLIRQALERTEGNQTQAAALLGLSRYGLIKKLGRYGLR